MFYSERLHSALDCWNAKRLYGVNPEKDPDRARKIGVFPVIPAPEGYSPISYRKEGDFYRALPGPYSIEEQQAIFRIEAFGLSLKDAAEKLGVPDTTDLVEEVAD